MGAGVAAVAGIENEPSSCCAAIEEAQAELREELAGRNERQRELEFLEKGGDPLAFKSGETPSGLWSLSPTNPFAKQLLPSDGKGSCPLSNRTKEDDVEYSPEDGSEFKRARSITGKFYFVDRGATTISIESTPPDALPTSISSSIQHDRKDAPKKEFDICKSNKAAVKGQYARRNRQRTNRFGNGCVAFRDTGKVGSSNYSSGVRGSLTYDAEPKDVVKEQLTEVTADQDALQSRETDVVACVREGQEKAGATNDHPDYDTAVQVCQPLLLETTHNTDASDLEEQDEDPRSMNQLPSSLPSSLQYNVEEGRNLPSSLPCNPEEGRNLPLSLPCDTEAKNSVTVELSRGLFAVSGTEEGKQSSDESAKSNLDPESMNKPCSGGIPEVNQVAEYEGIPNKANQVEKVSINDHISLPGHLSTFDVTRTRTASECRQRLDNKMNLMAVKSNNSTLEFTSGSHVLEDKVQGIAPSSLDNKSSNNGLFGKAQRLEEVKVKVEDEMPADAVRSPSVARVSLSNERPVNPSMPQEPITLPPQYLEGGNMSSGHDVAEGLQVRVSGANGLPTADKLSGVALPREKMDPRTLGDGTSDIETNLSAAKKADKNSTAQEAEGIKQDSLRQSADWAKRRDFQEPPRNKSHWDFVLEEMAWLANDFMQERLWKIAAAAQVARWVAKEKWQLEFEETELCNRQCKIARSLAKSVTKFWHSIEGFLLRDAVRADSTTVPSLSSTKTDPGADDEAHKAEAETVKLRVDKSKALPIQAYAIRFVENSLGWQPVAQAEAPPTPDRIAESGMSDFWEEQFPEESLFYTVPKHAMEVYRQSVVSEWEVEYEQRLQEHESILAETEVHVAGETTEYSAGIYAVGPLVSPLVTGKRSSGFHGGSHTNVGSIPTNVGSIPTKRMRTSAVAARQRAAGVTGPLVSGTAVHLTRSDISSCETNSQQDEMTNFLEGSSVSGRATDVDSNGAFARNNMAADGVDSPFKSKKKKKTRHFNGGHSASAACDMRESEQLWLHNFHRQSEQREHSKHKGEQLAQIGIGSSGLEGLGATAGSSHGAASVTSSASKLVKQMTNRDRGRKYKVGKASLSQPGLGIPWSPVEDQAILRLVYELGLNWELVSDILSSNSQLKGIFRKPKDCKERYKLLTDSRLGGDGGDIPDDPTSSTHLPISVTQKGGTRSLPQHLEETLRIHVDCILHLHQQLHSRKLQIESQEPKQLVPEHESHASKHTGLPGAALTPLELCELSSTTGESVSHAYPLQPAHGNGLGIPSMMSSGIGMRPNSAMSVLHGANNLQLSPSMSPSAAAATRDAQRLGSSMRPLTAEEHRLRHSRMVAGRGLQTQGLSVTSGLPLMGLSTATDCAAPPKLPSGNSAGLMSGLSRGMPLTRTGLPGMGPIGVPNISAGMNNVLPSVGMGLSGTGAVNPGAVSPPVSMMRRPREAMSMGHSQSATLNNPNSSLPNPVVSSPTQNLTAQQQQQLMQNNTLHAQQQGPGSSQQQAYNMMRVAKERQQLQQQHQKRMLQQQPGPTSNSSVSPFQSSQPLPVPQQQHVLSPHVHMYSQQHQPSHLLMQQHALQQEAGSQQQHAVGSIPSSNVQQSAQSPSGQPSLSGNSQNSQQQQLLSQAHQPTSSASSIQTPLQTKQHQNISMKQQQQQQQGKNIKGMGRGASTQGQSSILPNQLSPQLSGQQMVQGQRMVQSQGTVPSGGQQLAGAPQTAVQNLTVNLSQVPDAVVQQYQQKGFPQHLSGKHIPQQQPTSISTCPPIHPTSPPTGVSVPQQQPSPVTVASLPPTQQQRRAGQQSQTQQRRPQQPQSGSSISTQLASQSGKNGLQPSHVTCQLPVGFQLGSNMNSPLSMASPSGGIPLLSASTAGSGSVPSAQWKPGQSFSPMAAGLHNLSRSSGAAAQAPHLSMSMGMVMPLSNGNVPVTTNSLVTQEISRGGSQHASGHVGTLSQKPPVGSTATARAMPASQHMAPSQRQLAQQQQLSCMPNSAGGSQVRTASSGTTPAPE